MMLRTSPVLVLALILSAGWAFAGDDSEQTQTPRPLAPTERDLEQFQLPQPQVDLLGDTGRSPAFRFSGAGMFAASAADLVSTEVGLSRGFDEANPAASPRGMRIATHVAGPAVLYWATERMHRSGKKKLALGLRIGLMVVYSYAAFHNTRLMASDVP